MRHKGCYDKCNLADPLASPRKLWPRACFVVTSSEKWLAVYRLAVIHKSRRSRVLIVVTARGAGFRIRFREWHPDKRTEVSTRKRMHLVFLCKWTCGLLGGPFLEQVRLPGRAAAGHARVPMATRRESALFPVMAAAAKTAAEASRVPSRKKLSETSSPQRNFEHTVPSMFPYGCNVYQVLATIQQILYLPRPGVDSPGSANKPGCPE